MTYVIMIPERINPFNTRRVEFSIIPDWMVSKRMYVCMYVCMYCTICFIISICLFYC